MKLILDAVTVHCPECQHQYFRQPSQPLPAGSPLTCEECSREVYYMELLSQAADGAAA
jgi:hypothetical protein